MVTRRPAMLVRGRVTEGLCRLSDTNPRDDFDPHRTTRLRVLCWECLPAVVDEVGDEVDVIVDGGIRRGTDVFTALAIGACAVMVGRPVLWGLAVGGAEGVCRVLELLFTELDNTLALAGVPSVRQAERPALDLTMLTQNSRGR